MTDSAQDSDDELDKFQDEFIAAYKKRERKKRIAVVVLIVFVLLVWFLMQPLRGGQEYGICRTYLENYVRYPTSMKLTQYDVFGGSIRIFYSYLDPFGVHRSEMIECVAVPDPVQGVTMKDIKIDRKPIDREKLRMFNLSIPAILAGDPDLILPPLQGDEKIEELRPPDKDKLKL